MQLCKKIKANQLNGTQYLEVCEKLYFYCTLIAEKYLNLKEA